MVTDGWAASTHCSDALDDDVTHLQPPLQRQHLEKRLHGVADVVEVEVARIRPVVVDVVVGVVVLVTVVAGKMVMVHG